MPEATIALVTGASRGIGSATCLALARAGMTVGVGYRSDPEGAEETVAKARADGFVVSHGERFAGAVGISAPIRDAAGRVLGDIIAAWPDNRTDPEKERQVAFVVLEGADRISADLGFRVTVERR